MSESVLVPVAENVLAIWSGVCAKLFIDNRPKDKPWLFHGSEYFAFMAGSIAVTALFGTLRYSKGLNFPGVQQLHVLFKQLALTLGEVALALAFMGYLVHDSLLVSGLVVGVGMALSALQRMLEANAEEEPQWLKVPVLLALVSSVLYGLIKGNRPMTILFLAGLISTFVRDPLGRHLPRLAMQLSRRLLLCVSLYLYLCGTNSLQAPYNPFAPWLK